MVRYRSLVADSARWEGFAFRPDDIVISTPPKSGTTWMQTLCALLIFGTADLDRPMARISPWLDMLTRPLDDVLAELEAQTHRRFIKTHTPLDGLPWDPSVTYVCVGRDPRDVAVSWEHHAANMDIDAFMALRAAAVGLDDLAELGPPPAPLPDDPVERFWVWALDDVAPVPTLRRILHNLESYWRLREEPNVALFHYGDLKADLPGQLARLAAALGYELPRERIEELAAAATFEQMRSRATTLAPNSDEGFWRSTESFFHRGTSGQWRELLDEGDLDRYHQRVAELVPPDLATWVHHGWLGSPSTGGGAADLGGPVAAPASPEAAPA